MKEYTAKRLLKPDWDSVERVELVDAGWLEPCDIRAWAQLCHDGEKIYVRMEAKEKDVRAELKHPLDMICQDSCLEFFLAPCSEDHRYLNFEWNPIGNLYLGFGGPRDKRVRLIVEDVEDLFRPTPFKTAEGWGVEFEIPADFIRWYFPGFEIRGTCACNFYKCGDLTPTEHYLAWAPLSCATPDFHRRKDFGLLSFE